MKKQLIIVSIILCIVSICGCTQLQNIFDPVVRRAEPYINKIDTNNIELRNYANLIIKDCPPDNKEAQINAIYRYIVENYNYLSDPTDVELIQSPIETMK